MSDIATLVPNKSDKEKAEEYKKRIIEAYKPILTILDEASKDGFNINAGCGSTPLGFQLVQLIVSKIY